MHGDITEDHVFVDGDRLLAVIDWGDALVADRAYELPAILAALRGEPHLFDAFIDAADWRRDDLPTRAMQGILEFQFNAITAIAARVDLTSIATLDELAERLFAINRRG